MDIQNRNKDISQIFDSRWKANHNHNAVKTARDNEVAFINKMFNKKEDKPTQSINYMEERLKRLNDNMSALRNNRNKF